jgi:hypothetical protein
MGMANEKRLIDANEYPCQRCEVSYCYKNCKKFNEWFNKTVDAVEVVHGRWIYEPVEFSIVKDIRCSVCGRYVKVPENYCPDCGAKMDGGNEDG